MLRRFLLTVTFCALALQFSAAKSDSQKVSGGDVIREMNLARQNPGAYAACLESLRPCFKGTLFAEAGRPLLRTKEGVSAVNEAIRFLHSAHPICPLIVSTGMSRAAAEHIGDQANGRMGHEGSDSSNPGDRLNRYGNWSTLWGENISYGKRSAREIVLALIIDDGLRGRKHRANIFNSSFNYAGAALGGHAVYQTVCSIEFAAGYAERNTTSSMLLAGNP